MQGGSSGDVAPPEARDCFPACIAALRQECETPGFGVGSCLSTGTIMETRYCYSNGVRELQARVQGGARRTFTLPDGRTRSYLTDGDTVTLSGSAPGPDGSRIEFGTASGQVISRTGG